MAGPAVRDLARIDDGGADFYREYTDRIMKRFQGRFLAKSSPVHFFWGALDLALTRFSGRRHPEHPSTEWWVLREANSHEEISMGFWPGSADLAHWDRPALDRPPREWP